MEKKQYLARIQTFIYNVLTYLFFCDAVYSLSQNTMKTSKIHHSLYELDTFMRSHLTAKCFMAMTLNQTSQ